MIDRLRSSGSRDSYYNLSNESIIARIYRQILLVFLAPNVNYRRYSIVKLWYISHKMIGIGRNHYKVLVTLAALVSLLTINAVALGTGAALH